MTQYSVSFQKFKRRVRLRYFYLPIIIGILTVMLPGVLDLYPDQVPLHGAYDTSPYGFSEVMSRVKARTLREYSEIPSGQKLLIIPSPFRYFQEDIEFLDRWLMDGGYILALGEIRSLSLSPILEYNSEMFVGDRLMRENDENPFHLDLEMDDVIYKTINAHMISTFTNLTYSLNVTADPVQCGIECRDVYTTVGIKDQIILLPDFFMLQNQYTSMYPQNLDFLGKLIKKAVSGEVAVYFDETHLNWAPLSRVALNLWSQSLLRFPAIVFLFVLLIIFIPSVLILRRGYFRDSFKRKETIHKRIDSLNVEKTIAVPLTKEEEIIVDLIMLRNTQKSAFLSTVGGKLLDHIMTEQISVSSDVRVNLEHLATNHTPEHIAWKIIEMANIAMKSEEEN